MPGATFWDTWGRPEIFAISMAVGVALLVMLSVRRRAGSWLIPCLTFLPVPLVALFSKQFNLVGWHGFMHAAPIYQMMAGGAVPPEDPLFAGGSLRYPWVEHWVVAQLSRFSGASVHLLTVWIEVGAYAALLGAGWWLASTVTEDRGAIALGVLFTGFGISVFHVGLLAEPFQRAFPGLWLESRVVPLDKFANLSAMPLGYACLAVASAAGVRLSVAAGPPTRLALIIAVCTLSAALVHPLSWLCILPFQGAVGLVLIAARNREDYRRLVWLGAAVIAPSLLALPYLFSVGVSESSDGWSGLTRSAELFWAKAGDAAVFLAPLLGLVYLQRATLRRMLSEGNRALRILLVAVASLAAAYLVLRFPGRNEYKFLLCLVIAGAPLLGLCLRGLLDRHGVLAGVFLLLLLTPGSRALGFRPWFEVTRPCRTDGPYLRAVDRAADRLYQWVARETPADSVFVTADLGIPPLGRRGLYVALDAPWRGRDGWGLEPFSLRQWHVRRPDAVMHARHEQALLLLDPAGAGPATDVIARIQDDVPNRPVFVHSNDPEVLAKLDRTAGFIRRFRNTAGAIYATARWEAPMLGSR